MVGVLPFRESSAIFKIFTPDHGILTIMAKGARRPKSPYVGCLRTFVKGEFILYHNEKSEFYYMSEAQVIDDPESLLTNSDRYLLGSAMLELIIKITPSGVINRELYYLLNRYTAKLKSLKAWNEMFGLFLSFFILALVDVGVFPPLNRCVVCSSYDVKYFSTELGGAICGRHKTNKTRFSAQVNKAMALLIDGNFGLNSAFLGTIYELLCEYCKFHLGDLEFATRFGIDRKLKVR